MMKTYLTRVLAAFVLLGALMLSDGSIAREESRLISPDGFVLMFCSGRVSSHAHCSLFVSEIPDYTEWFVFGPARMTATVDLGAEFECTGSGNVYVMALVGLSGGIETTASSSFNCP